MITRTGFAHLVLAAVCMCWMFCAQVASADAFALSGTSSDHVAVGSGSGDYRRVDEQVLQSQLSAHLQAETKAAEEKRIALRRKIHEEHIRAHLAVDPDISIETPAEVRQRFLTAREELLKRHRRVPLSPLKAFLLVFVFGIPVVIFAIWIKA